MTVPISSTQSNPTTKYGFAGLLERKAKLAEQLKNTQQGKPTVTIEEFEAQKKAVEQQLKSLADIINGRIEQEFKFFG